MTETVGALLRHPASLLVALVIGLFVLRQVRQSLVAGAAPSLPVRGPVASGLISGALTGNGLVHYLHGASGATFAAPFAFLFASPMAGLWLNIAWGTFCLLLALRFALNGAGQSPARFAHAYAGGLALIGAFLAWIFGS